LDLSRTGIIIEPLGMVQPSPQKRSKRRQQLRDAQRRRRARLKEANKSFLQIILTDDLLDSLRRHSESRGLPLHITATELLRAALEEPAPGAVCVDRFAGTAGEDARSCGVPGPGFYDGQLDLFDWPQIPSSDYPAV